MSLADRARLLRQRWKFSPIKAANKPLGMFCAVHPDTTVRARKPRTGDTTPHPPRWRNWSTNFAPFAEPAKEMDVGWVMVADPKPLPVPKPKRTKHVSALAKIAEQLPKKLPRVIGWDRPVR